jgi:hypothetical protein
MEGGGSCKIRWKELEDVNQMEGDRRCKIIWKEPEAVRSDGRSQKL